MKMYLILLLLMISIVAADIPAYPTNTHLIYLTVDSEQIFVNLVADAKEGGYLLIDANGNNQNLTHVGRLTYGPKYWLAQTKSLYTGMLTSNAGSDFQLEYRLPDIQDGPFKFHSFRVSHKPTKLTVCAFSGYLEQSATRMDANLSEYIEMGRCQLTLFIGDVNYEQTQDRQFIGNPFRVYDPLNIHWSRLQSLSRVPSILGSDNECINQTDLVNVVEINGVAFVQYSNIVLSTRGPLDQRRKSFDRFNDTFYQMELLKELECKLNELNRRIRRPWIIAYLVNPYLAEPLTGVCPTPIYYTSIDGIMELFERYKVDVLLLDNEYHLHGRNRTFNISGSRPLKIISTLNSHEQIGNNVMAMDMYSVAEHCHQCVNAPCDYTVLQMSEEEIRIERIFPCRNATVVSTLHKSMIVVEQDPDMFCASADSINNIGGGGAIMIIIYLIILLLY